MKYFSLLFLAILSISISAQNQDIIIDVYDSKCMPPPIVEPRVFICDTFRFEVRDVLTHQPIPYATIQMNTRKVVKLENNHENIPILLPYKSNRFVMEKVANAAGCLTLMYGMEVGEYHEFEISANAYQTRKFFVKPDTFSFKKCYFEMFPLEMSAEYEAALLEKNEADIIANTQAKEETPLEEGSTPLLPASAFGYEKTHGTLSVCDIDSFPTQVYVSNLVSGYNSTATGTGFTGLINFDEYLAGVVQKEIGGVTALPHALMAQVIAARTFSYKKHLLGQPVNVGQSYDFNPNAGCIAAANQTTKQVLVYNNTVITANYAARCNGNFTQNSENGRWGAGTCGAQCATCGNPIAYLRSVVCSGHNSCTATPNEQPCCELTISTVNTLGNIYGHGVGLCQRGTQQFAGAPFNWSYCDILTRFYTNVCIANATCTAGVSTFSVATMANPKNTGTIIGGGIYSLNDGFSVTASPASGFVFEKWTEGANTLSTSPTLTGTVTANRNLVAHFSPTSDISTSSATNISLIPLPDRGAFFIPSLSMIKGLQIFNAMGQTVAFDAEQVSDGQNIWIHSAASGMYFVNFQIDNQYFTSKIVF